MFSTKNLVKKHQEISKNARSVLEKIVKDLDDADKFPQKDIGLTSARVNQLIDDKVAMQKIQSNNPSLSVRLKELLEM